MKYSSQDTFYKNGLRFECTRCSKCCRHDPGYVFLSEEDIENIVLATGLSRSEVLERYCRRVQLGIAERVSLKEKKNFDCIFWEESGCAIYNYRPLQCRSYPFWAAIVGSQEAWEREANHCPGINRGKKHSQKCIDTWLELRARTKLLS